MLRLTMVFALLAALAVPALPAAAGEAELVPGDQGGRVAILQERLAQARFYRGPFDGVYGEELEQAVVAFHKEMGTERDAVWRSEDWELLATYRGPGSPERPDEPDRVEINLTRQVLYLFLEGELAAVMPVSSGNGEPYRTSSGALVHAHTPRGDFTFERHIDGWRTSYLGQLYRPWYFIGGYALHGSPSVPPYPASHGCVRVPIWDADWLESRLWIGMPVHVWDEPAGAGPTFGEPDPAIWDLPFVDDEGLVHEEAIGTLAVWGITKGCTEHSYCPLREITREEMAAFLVRAFGYPPGPDAFSDDEDSFFEAEIDALAAAGVTLGCAPGLFCPDRSVTREQMAAFLVRALDLPPAAAQHFEDHLDSPFRAEIDALAEAGITEGCAQDRFCPTASVTRAQMASFLVRALD